MSTATKNVKGLLGTKLGMTQVWDENNKLVPVTVIKIAPNVVTQVRTPEKDGYEAVQIAAGAIDPRKVNQPAAGHFKAAGVTPPAHGHSATPSCAAAHTPARTALPGRTAVVQRRSGTTVSTASAANRAVRVDENGPTCNAPSARGTRTIDSRGNGSLVVSFR